MTPTLRPYQSTSLDRVCDKIRNGTRSVLLVSPTGSGKTVTAAELVRRSLSEGAPVLFLAHRREIIGQTERKLAALGIRAGVIMAGRKAAPWLSVQIASPQTLVRRAAPPAGLVIVDEAHHVCAATYRKILGQYPGVPVVGLTATPWREDNRGLGDLFDDLVVATTPAELIAQGHLVRYRTRQFDSDNSEFIVRQWLKSAGGVRTVAFAESVERSRELVTQFRRQGVTAEHLDGATPADEREAILARLESGLTRVISNVSVLTEGWDCPSATCCILARPTKSLTLYLQMVGRVLRPHGGKTHAIINDHCGAIEEHGPPDAPREYFLLCESRPAGPTEVVQPVLETLAVSSGGGGGYCTWPLAALALAALAVLPLTCVYAPPALLAALALAMAQRAHRTLGPAA